MGCFSYTCQLSGVPITYGEPAAIIPMIPSKHWYEYSEENIRKYGAGSYCSNDGSNIFFNEIGFPIFGTYDDYGGIEDIIEDDNTKVLEKYFGLTIEEIVSVLLDGRRDELFEKPDLDFSDSKGIIDLKNPKHLLLIKSSVTWIHGGVYSKLASAKLKGEHAWYDKLDIGKPEILTRLGFKFKGVDKTKERFNQQYEKDGLSVWGDGTWITGSIHTLEELQKYCKKNKVNIDISMFAGKGRMEQTYDYLLPGCKKSKSSDDAITRLLSFKPERSILHMFFLDEYSIFEGPKKGSREELLSFYYNEVIEKQKDLFMKENIIDWHAVKTYFYSTGRYMIPIGTSPQCGDPENVGTLLKTSLAVIKNQLTNREGE